MDNAVRFTGVKGGGQVDIDIDIKNREFIVTIKDNGVGIAEADLPHIFERFFRGSDSENANLGGSGLGLSVAEGIVKAHNGRISVDSCQGEGSTFTVVLPVRCGELS